MDPVVLAQLSTIMGHNGGLAVTSQGQAQQGGPAAVPTGGRRENYDDHIRAALKGFSNVPLDGGVKGKGNLGQIPSVKEDADPSPDPKT